MAGWKPRDRVGRTCFRCKGLQGYLAHKKQPRVRVFDDTVQGLESGCGFQACAVERGVVAAWTPRGRGARTCFGCKGLQGYLAHTKQRPTSTLQ